MDQHASSISPRRGNHSPQRKRVEILKTESAYKPIELDERWAELSIEGPTIQSRSYTSMTLQNGSVIIYGGFDEKVGILDDFWYLKLADSENYTWKPVQVSNNQVKPGKRRRHTSIVHQDNLYIFGGQQNTIYNCNSFHAFDFQNKTWKVVEGKGSVPPPIDSHGAVVYKDKMIVVCGFIGDKYSNYCNSVYAYDFASNNWDRLFKNDPSNSNAPAPRANMSCCLYKDSIYIYGGCTFEKKFNDIWKFDLISNSWSLITSQGQIQPEERSGHSMIEYKDSLYIFGGIQDVTKEKNDLYEFNLNSREWKRVHYEKPIEFVPPQKLKESNVILESPTKKGRSPHKKVDVHSLQRSTTIDPKAQQSRNAKQESDIATIQQYSYNLDGDKQTTTFVDQKKQQQQAYMKYAMLKELVFEIDDKDKLGADPDSPVSDAMKHSIKQIGDPRGQKQQPQHNQHNNSTNLRQNTLNGNSSTKNMSINQLDLMTSSKENFTFESAVHDLNSTLCKPPKQFILGENLLIGKKPCARDGASLCLLQDGKIIVFGGDRHLMSFNDIYFFNLEGKIQPKQ